MTELVTRSACARIAACACALVVLAVPTGLLAQPAPGASPSVLAPVVVTATRTDAVPFDIPASIDRVGAEAIRDAHPLISLAESLGGVPGLLARDRQNYAQDVQISVRGFGARSNFGVRGVRIYVDGIPATLPDGQSQTSNIDLASASRIEVLRGPFSALYGNSSGGVIQTFTEDPVAPPTLGVSVTGGSDAMQRIGSTFVGTSGVFGVVASLSDFRTDGYRDHSETNRQLGNLKLRITPSDDDTFTLIANSVSLSTALDPLGLSRKQFETDPRSVDPSALRFDTRKTVDQSQGGVIYERRVDAANALRVLLYGGHRNTEQFQSIPVASQASPLSPGGVIALGRDYQGTDVRWTWTANTPDQPLTLVAGLAYDALKEHRQGYQNFIGTTLGVRGALRRDEANDVSNFDQYLQVAWQFAPQWSLNAGFRHSEVRFASQDAYIVGANPDDSGSATYSATLPVLGVMYALSSEWHLYATAGRGFETPTLNELAYRPNGATGLNFDLQKSQSSNFEIGVKARLPGIGDFTAAVFETHTDHEIVTLSNLGGRSTFQNAGTTQRRGFEGAWSASLHENVNAQAALTLLDARYTESFKTCTVTPCTALAQTTIPAGNRIPGTASSVLFASLAWAPPQGFRAGIEARWLSRVFVNDLNSDAAAGYGIASANIGYVLRAGAWGLTGFVRSDNLFNRRYVGSVIVNEGNSRFFETAPGQIWVASVSASVAF